MIKNRNPRNLVYALVAAPLVAAGVWGGVDIYKNYKETTAQAEQALEAKDYSTAREILSLVESEIKDGSLIVPLSSRMEARLEKMLAEEKH